MHAPVAEVSVGEALESVGAEQGVEVAQVGPQPGRGDSGVLPPSVRRPRERHPGEAGAVGPDPPQRGGRDGVGDPALESVRRGDEAVGPVRRLAEVVAGDLDEDPAVATRQGRDGGGSELAPHHVDDVAR